jgi:hypothetical protein
METLNLGSHKSAILLVVRLPTFLTHQHGIHDISLLVVGLGNVVVVVTLVSAQSVREHTRRQWRRVSPPPPFFFRVSQPQERTREQFKKANYTDTVGVVKYTPFETISDIGVDERTRYVV